MSGPITLGTGLALPLLAVVTIGVACALLSVFVVLRRWAFVGEGIAHAGFGGAGTAWLLSLVFPSAAFLQSAAGTYVVAVIFSLLVGAAIAHVTRRRDAHADTAIGIFLVASLAWGFLAQAVYTKSMGGNTMPPDFTAYLVGRVTGQSPEFLVGVSMIAAAVVVVVVGLFKEIVAYSFDPLLAEVSGVRAGFVHYLLLVLISLVIVIGMRLIGSVLVTALIVLPGAAGRMVSKRLAVVVGAAVVTGVVGTAGGVLVHAKWRFVPEGAAIVLVLVLAFVGAWGWGTVKGMRGGYH